MAKKTQKKQTRPVEVKAQKPIRKAKFRIGDIGKEVKAFQKELGLPETGIYDQATHEAATK